MAGNDAATKFFDALNESYDAMIDGIKFGNQRGQRISAALIDEAQRGQREAVELAKKWTEAPLDLVGYYSGLMEATTKAQGRALDFATQWVEEMTGSQKEGREVMERMVGANRKAGEAAVEVARGVFSRASEAVQSAARSSSGLMGDGSAPTPAEPARTSEAEASGPSMASEP